MSNDKQRTTVTLDDGTLVHIDGYIGEDGAPVIHVDTQEIPDGNEGPWCRVYVNDGIVHDGTGRYK